MPRPRSPRSNIAPLALTACLLSAATPLTHAQWQLEESHSSANLRGIHSLGGGVAWASGSKGTVLRTEDGGFVWQGCATPPGAETLDLRAIQAFDEQTAIVMSAGPGAASRLFRTTDGCRSWTPLLINKDKDGFWDALRFRDRRHGILLGDPVNGRFVVLTTSDGGTTWQPDATQPVDEATGQSIFAASNSSLLLGAGSDWSFCTGGSAGPHLWTSSTEANTGAPIPGAGPIGHANSSEELISDHKAATAGCFSLASAKGITVAVGGDYGQPDEAEGTAWTTALDPQDTTEAATAKAHPLFRFRPAAVTPEGYRSAVAFDPGSKTWIAVGPTGTDTSTDGGLHWHALKPLPGAPAGQDGGWNALSLPFAVGPHGSIARLRTDALVPSASPPAR